MNHIHNPDFRPVEDVIMHRRTARMLDGVTELDAEAGSAAGFWTPDALHFDGHFDGMPILPGIKQIEAGAQLGAYLAIETEDRSILPLFGSIEHAVFARPVRMDETIDLQVAMLDRDKRKFKGEAVASVSGELACRAIIVGAILPEKVARRMLEQS